jgi:hypothetical protein
MAVQLDISYETLAALVEQLPPEQQADLIERLSNKQPSMTVDAWIERLNGAVLDIPIKEIPSIRREDWYDNDGR